MNFYTACPHHFESTLPRYPIFTIKAPNLTEITNPIYIAVLTEAHSLHLRYFMCSDSRELHGRYIGIHCDENVIYFTNSKIYITQNTTAHIEVEYFNFISLHDIIKAYL